MSAVLLALLLAMGPPEGDAPPGPSYSAYEHIRALKPSMSVARSRDLARLVGRKARRYGLPPEVIVAIIRQESHFQAGAKNCYVVSRRRANWVTCDLGLSQVNLQWVSRWGLNPCRLQWDDDYNLDVGARILRDLRRRYGQAEPLTWWTRYNSPVDYHRARYGQAVRQWLPR
jgi:soluble lytic murein transglycosylase-like protein